MNSDRAQELAAKYAQRLKDRGEKIVSMEPLDTVRIKRRVQSMTTEELMVWVDLATAGIGRSVIDYAEKKAPESLDEAEQGAATLLEVIAELKRRHNRL